MARLTEDRDRVTDQEDKQIYGQGDRQYQEDHKQQAVYLVK